MEKTKKIIFAAFSWFFGIVFLLSSLRMLKGHPLTGFCFLAMALIVLPPIRNFVFSKTGKTLTRQNRLISVVALFVVSSVLLSYEQGKEDQIIAKQERQAQAIKNAQIKEDNIKYFNANQQQILSAVSQALREKNYQSVITQSNKYLVTGNKDLVILNTKAKNILAEQNRKEVETKKQAKNEKAANIILDKLKAIPSSEYVKNKTLYQQLLTIYPSNQKYQAKFNYYSKKIADKKDKERLEILKIKKKSDEQLAKFGKKPIASGWDGSYYPVKTYLKKIANDPDSIKMDGCTEVYLNDNGWLVGCNYRGKNAFGGMIRQSNWFTIVHGQVISMQDYSTYKE